MHQYHQKKYSNSLLYITIFLKCFPNSFQAYILKSRCYIKLFQFNKSIVLLNKAIKLNVNDVTKTNITEILFLKGKCYMNIKEFQNAIECYNQINSIKENARAYLNKGVCYYKSKLINKAIENYDIAIKMNPTYTEAIFNKGICLINLDKKEEAIEVFNKILAH